MNEKIEKGAEHRAVLAHQDMIHAARQRLDHVQETIQVQRAAVADCRAKLPDLAALERAEADVLAAVALGNASQQEADKATADLAAARNLERELSPRIKTGESTISGLDRAAAEIAAEIAGYEAQSAGKLRAFLEAEMELEGSRYVQAAAALIRSYSRLTGMSELAVQCGREAYKSWRRIPITIGRDPSLDVFVGHQQSSLHPDVLFGSGGKFSIPGATPDFLKWKREEQTRLEQEMGIKFGVLPTSGA